MKSIVEDWLLMIGPGVVDHELPDVQSTRSRPPHTQAAASDTRASERTEPSASRRNTVSAMEKAMRRSSGDHATEMTCPPRFGTSWRAAPPPAEAENTPPFEMNRR